METITSKIIEVKISLSINPVFNPKLAMIKETSALGTILIPICKDWRLENPDNLAPAPEPIILLKIPIKVIIMAIPKYSTT